MICNIMEEINERDEREQYMKKLSSMIGLERETNMFNDAIRLYDEFISQHDKLNEKVKNLETDTTIATLYCAINNLKIYKAIDKLYDGLKEKPLFLEENRNEWIVRCGSLEYETKMLKLIAILDDFQQKFPEKEAVDYIGALGWPKLMDDIAKSDLIDIAILKKHFGNIFTDTVDITPEMIFSSIAIRKSGKELSPLMSKFVLSVDDAIKVLQRRKEYASETFNSIKETDTYYESVRLRKIIMQDNGLINQTFIESSILAQKREVGEDLLNAIQILYINEMIDVQMITKSITLSKKDVDKAAWTSIMFFQDKTEEETIFITLLFCLLMLQAKAYNEAKRYSMENTQHMLNEQLRAMEQKLKEEKKKNELLEQEIHRQRQEKESIRKDYRKTLEKKIVDLEKDVEKLQDQLMKQEIEQELERSNQDMHDAPPTLPTVDLSNHSVLLVGGHEIFANKIKQELPFVDLVDNTQVNFSNAHFHKYDVVIFRNDHMNHSIFRKVKSGIHEQATVVYSNINNIDQFKLDVERKIAWQKRENK